MNKLIKKIINLGFLIVISFCFLSLDVRANNIKQISIDVYIDESGNASITEVWNATLTQGTEGYRPYTNLGNATISNFVVSDDSGQLYESLPSWNANASFESKSYRSGIQKISSGIELCWGISKYGDRTYTLKYDINNLVVQYTDAQGIYFNFLNLDQSVNGAKITIHSDISFSLNNAKIWAFGNRGTIHFMDGKIELDSVNSLSKEEYMTSLIKFESNFFNTSNKINASFDDIYNSATSDVVDSDSSESNNLLFSIYMLIVLILPILPFLLIFPISFIIIIIFWKRISKMNLRSNPWSKKWLS